MAEKKPRKPKQPKTAPATEVEPFDSADAVEQADQAAEAATAGMPRDLAPDRRPWEKQPWESFQAFQAFAVYRDLGLARSQSKASQALVETVAGDRSPATIKTQMGGWSVKNRWIDRAEAYDLYVDERMREQREGRIDRQNRRYESAAATASAKLLRRIAGGDAAQADGLKELDMNELDAEAAIRALVNLQRIERIATGQPTELVKGAFLISSGDVEKMAREITEGLMQFVPEERQPLAAQWLMQWASGGGRIAE